MGAKSNIEWTDATWNPVTGCTKVSAGCKNCYAETWAKRHLGEFGKDRARKFTDIQMHPDKLDIPLRWQKPRNIFVNSMSDLFHDEVDYDFIDNVFSIMALAKKHTFQVLTKRVERMHEYIMRIARSPKHHPIHNAVFDAHDAMYGDGGELDGKWPLPNVWLGVSVENQETFDERVPLLLKTPAAIRWISAEPLLGPINCDHLERLNWVVVGGESGHGARPMHPDWVRSIRDQCRDAGVPFFFKQWGEWVTVDLRDSQGKTRIVWNCESMERIGKKAAGRVLDGRTWDEFPNVSRS